jgi:hypothetical protein
MYLLDLNSMAIQMIHTRHIQYKKIINYICTKERGIKLLLCIQHTTGRANTKQTFLIWIQHTTNSEQTQSQYYRALLCLATAAATGNRKSVCFCIEASSMPEESYMISFWIWFDLIDARLMLGLLYMALVHLCTIQSTRTQPWYTYPGLNCYLLKTN